MRKLTITVLVIVVLALLAYSQRADIAKRIMSRGVEVAMANNTLAELGDGLHLAICGAGGPMPDIKRSGACVAVVAGDRIFLVDTGTNGLRSLARMRYPLGNVAAVLLTHFHSDHIDGLGETATLRWVSAANTSPLPVIGPQGVTEVVGGFNTAYELDTVYRHEHHGDLVAPLSGKGMVAVEFPLPAPGELTTVYEEDGLKIQMLAVDHRPIDPAAAYLFSYQGRTILVSGDTVKSANLQHFARGVDILVHEALSPEMLGIMHDGAVATGNEVMAKVTVDVLNYHTTPVEAAEIARDAGVGELVYYHIVPPLIFPGAEAAWLEGVDEVFENYTLSQDGTSFTLPPNSKDIIQTREKI
jgi:ribonuclease Z